MLTVYLDRMTSRRGKAHFVASNEDEPIYWKKDFGDMLLYLDDADQRHFLTSDGVNRYEVTIRKLTDKEFPNHG